MFTYNIYWVDDEIQVLQDTETVKEIETHLVQKCYRPKIKISDSYDSAQSLNLYDLIITDFNLTDGQETGYEILRSLRNNHHMTEALIYSSKPEHLEEALKNHFLERLSYVTRRNGDGYRSLKKKIKDVIDISISKMEDVNILRGLVMAECSEIHSLLLDKISNIQAVDIRDKVEKYAHAKYSESLKSRNNRMLREFSENKIPLNRLDESIFDANLIRRLFGKYLSCLGVEHEGFLVEYENILKTRNELGHCKNIDQNRLQTANGEREFDSEECYNLRHKIIQIREKIEEVE